MPGQARHLDRRVLELPRLLQATGASPEQSGPEQGGHEVGLSSGGSHRERPLRVPCRIRIPVREELGAGQVVRRAASLRHLIVRHGVHELRSGGDASLGRVEIAVEHVGEREQSGGGGHQRLVPESARPVDGTPAVVAHPRVVHAEEGVDSHLRDQRHRRGRGLVWELVERRGEALVGLLVKPDQVLEKRERRRVPHPL